MLEKGTMEPVKKVLGYGLIAYAVSLCIKLNVEIPRTLLIAMLVVSGYFLLISGRQR